MQNQDQMYTAKLPIMLSAPIDLIDICLKLVLKCQLHDSRMGCIESSVVIEIKLAQVLDCYNLQPMMRSGLSRTGSDHDPISELLSD